jgi:outer membrane cobalamin receptor
MLKTYKVLLIGVFTYLNPNAFSQTFTISGYVRDTSSAEKIVNATVSADSSNVVVATGVHGFYSITLPIGLHEIKATGSGFFAKRMVIDLQKDEFITWELVAGEEMSAVRINVSRVERIEESSRMGNISLSGATIKKVPMLMGEPDVLKALQLLPGVKPGVEGTSGLFVRGGSPDQNLMLLDGTPLYNVSHLFGFFSTFNADAINTVELTKGGFPARYGGRLSSVVDITTKDGNMRHWNVYGNLGILAISGTVEGPILKDKLSILVSGRRTYAGAIGSIIAPYASGSRYFSSGYYFYDLNGKITWNISKKDKLFLSTYGGDDLFYQNYRAQDFIFDGQKYTNSSKDELGWGNRVASLRYTRNVSPKMFNNTILSYTRYRYRNYQDDYQNEIIADSAVFSSENLSDFTSQIRDISLKTEWDYNPDDKNRIKFGGTIIRHHFEPGGTRIKNFNPFDNIRTDTFLGSTPVNGFENFVFIENDQIINSRIKLNYGLHYSQFILPKKFYHSLQPRISGRYLMAKSWALKASATYMQQYIHLLSNNSLGLPTDLWVPTTDVIPPEKSWQYSLGIAKTLANKYIFSVEGYYKTMENVLEYKDGAAFLNSYEAWYDKISVGKGWSRGIEVFLQKKVGRLNGWISYTLSKSDRQFNDINNGEKFLFKYDSRHSGAVFATYTFDETYSLSASWVYSTGIKFTLADISFQGVTASSNSVDLTTYAKRNQYTGADFHRLDLTFTKTFNKKWGKINMNFGAYNIYSRINPFAYSITQDPRTGLKQLQRQGLFPILPFISLTFNNKK